MDIGCQRGIIEGCLGCDGITPLVGGTGATSEDFALMVVVYCMSLLLVIVQRDGQDRSTSLVHILRISQTLTASPFP